MNRRSQLVYGLLAAAWIGVVAWQIIEHARVRRLTRESLVNRAKDISNTLGLVMRSQRRFGGVISQERMESALTSLIKPGEVDAIELLNDAGDVVASAGNPVGPDLRAAAASGTTWGRDAVALLNLVDLGTNVTSDLEAGSRPTIVLPRDMFSPFGTNRPPPPPDDSGRPGFQPGTSSGSGEIGPPPASPEGDDPTNQPPRPRARFRQEGGGGRPPFGRPFWMSEEDYRSMIQKKGVHSFVILMSTREMRSRSSQDFWLRSIIALLAAVSSAGLAFAWRNLTRSSELEVRLVRASELNTRLKEMNLAAAGLAHETKNPLNIIRGLAQMISRREDAIEEVRHKARDIVDETDRVTAQLNEFINYSRPREVRRAAVNLGSAAREVVRALGYDLEEKGIHLELGTEFPTVDADDQLLRQALFNLLLNAIQAVPRGGTIQIEVVRELAGDVGLEIRDDGPGIAAEYRSEIFKPYFTTRPDGTGLGLAVVHQIALAHGWEVAYRPNAPQGAVFRLAHLRLATLL